ncbi:unnamed protein product [Gongylonema pulchrum]|uniref:SANT domain-containing protein n=1 Tax=Gongylonema pulchrum TaxID=637853 RepID=A0A183DRX3_9BILA|nr:unnamed protein product [Gongylonema pulchrum]
MTPTESSFSSRLEVGEGAQMEEVVCCNCEVQLSRKECLFVQCEECLDAGTDVKLCTSCFRMGAECGPHKRGHAYIVRDCKGASLLGSGKSGKQWGWKEDLNLIRAVRKHKLGNWEEIASELCSTKTADDAKNRFDRHFVRGAFGRYTAAVCSHWPHTYEYMEGGVNLSARHGPEQPVPASSISKWECVAKFFRTSDRSKTKVDFDNPNWFAEFEADLMDFRSEFSLLRPSTSALEEDTDVKHLCDVQRPNSSLAKNRAVSPVSVHFFKSTASVPQYAPQSYIILRMMKEVKQVAAAAAAAISMIAGMKLGLATMCMKIENLLAYGVQNIVQLVRYLEVVDASDKKPVLRLKRVGSDWRKTDGTKQSFSKEECVEKLKITVSSDAKEMLLRRHQGQFHANFPLLPLGAEERSKLKEDDLQLLAYMPERDDFEWEFNNSAEMLVSHLMAQARLGSDEDSAFETAVKIAKIQKYNRTLKQRKAKKATAREYEFVNKFFHKIKKIDDPRRTSICNQQLMAAGVASWRQEYLHSLLKKVYQVTKKAELEQLLDAITGCINLNDKILELEKLRADGIMQLKGRWRSKVTAAAQDRSKTKRRRRPHPSNDMQRKAALRWKRFKRWTKQQAADYGSVESDT